MAAAAKVKVDVKRRLTLPPSLCNALGIEPGDTFVVEADERGTLLRHTPKENPFDVLAEHALAEYRAGRTQNLRAFAAENGIALGDD